ncbi:MAG: hypothetical protein FWC67_01845 [Defluviitaleaceae bacterium]|nr:hypothetical protein [Defluviitaleaceae bacterium]
MKTEKISVNLNPVELGQIDFLVAKGLFDSRSDFMRMAARKQLEKYPICDDFTVGVVQFPKSEIDRLLKEGKKARLRVVGILAVGTSVTADDIRATVENCIVHGKIVADAEVKAVLKQLQEN